MRCPSRLLAAVLPLALLVPLGAGTAAAQEEPPPTGSEPTAATAAVTVTDLGVLDAWTGVGGRPGGLNEKGEVAASRWVPNVDGHASALLLRGGEVVDLHPTIAGASGSAARDVNNAGDVVGVFSGERSSSFLYRDGTARDLGRYGAEAVSESGWVTGAQWVRDPAGTFVDLGTLGGQSARATDVNDSGVVVGVSDADPQQDSLDAKPFRTRPGRPIDPATDRLPVLFGGSAAAYAVNEQGVAAGFATGFSGGKQPSFWEPDGTQRLVQTVSGGEAVAINDGGTAVGTLYTADGDRAGMFAGTSSTDLNTLLPTGSPWVLKEATGINDAGQIAGWGQVKGPDEWQRRAFLLTLGEGPVIDWVRVEEREQPSGSWVPVGEDGTVDGNRLRITVSVTNRSRAGAVAGLEVLDEDGVVDGGKTYEGLEPGETVVRQFSYDTAGLAWEGEGAPRTAPYALRARVTAGGTVRDAREQDVLVRPRPVVLVHGYKSNALSSWGKFHEILRSGHPLLKSWAVGDAQAPGVMNTGSEETPFAPTGTIAENAAEEAEYIAWVRDHEDAAQVDVVAHSMGGLISRYYVQELMPEPVDGAPVVNRLVMMGTPHRGSPCADIALDWEADRTIERAPLMPATMQLSTSWVASMFNPFVTERRGVVFSNLVGVGQVVPCSWDFPVGDLVVTQPSAEHDLTDKPTTQTDHLDMTESPADVAAYVLPRLSAPPASAEDALRTSGDGAGAGVGEGPVPVAQAPTGFATAQTDVEPGQSAEVALDVPDGVSFGVMAVGRSEVGLALVDASGTERASFAAGSDQARQPFVGLGVEGHEPGPWTLRVTNTGTEPVQVPVSAWIAGNGVAVEPTAEQAGPDGRVRVSARVTDEGAGLPGATVEAVLLGEAGERVELALLDDGQSDDGAAGDGTYAATTSEALVDGGWSVVVRADTGQGRRTGRTAVQVERVDTGSYRLDVSTGPGGSTTVDPVQDNYPAGSEVTVTAAARPGFVLSGWTVDGRPAGATQALVVRMDRDHEVVARFHTYAVTDLGTLSDVPTDEVSGAALNDAGQVAGTSPVRQGTHYPLHAFRWTDGELEDLGTLPCAGPDGPLDTCWSSAAGMNSAGTVVGYATEAWAGGGANRAFVAEAGAPMRHLTPLPDRRPDFESSPAQAYDVNDAGQVLGDSAEVDEQWDYHWRNVRWQADGTLELLPGLDMTDSDHAAINSSGDVVGYRWPEEDGYRTRAAVWRDGAVTDVPLPDTARCTDGGSAANDLSDGGVVVGEFCTPDGYHAFVTDGEDAVDLGPGEALAVNESGLVVGEVPVGAGSGGAALWQGGVLHELEDLVPGACPRWPDTWRHECWGFSEAVDVNESGQVLVNGSVLAPRSEGSHGFVRHPRAFLLTPVTAEADLEVRQQVSAPAALPGTELTWTTTVTNAGPGTATDVRLSATLPTGAAVSGCRTSSGEECSGTGADRRVVVRELVAGASATLTVTGTVDPGTAAPTTLTASALAYTLAVRDPGGDATAESSTSVGMPFDEPNLNFFGERVGRTSLPATVVLTNRGSVPLTVGALEVPTDFAATSGCTMVLAPGGTCSIAVTWTPAAAGVRDAVLLVPTTATAAPLRVTLHGEAAAGNTRPTAGTPGAGSVEGSAPVLSLPFTDPDPGDAHTAQVIWEGVTTGPVPATVVAGPGGGTVTSTSPFVATDQGTARVVVLLHDGKESSFAAVDVPVANAVPVVDLGEAVTLDVGQPLDRSGSFTDPGADTWTATVDYGDGPEPLPLSGKGLALSRTWTAAGTYPVRVAVSDEDGGTGTAELVVVVRSSNTAPALSLGDPVTVAEGTPLDRSVAVVDPDADVLTATVDYGDGSGEQPLPVDGRVLRLSRTWAEDGPREVTVRVDDGHGGAAVQVLPVTVVNAAPAVTITGPVAGAVVQVGQPVALTGALRDPGTADTHVARWTVGAVELDAAVDPASGAVTGTWTPTEPGVHLLQLTVTDDDGGAGTASTVDGAPALVVVEEPPAPATRAHVTAGGWYAPRCATPVACDATAERVSLGLVARTGRGVGGQLVLQLPGGTRVTSSRVTSTTVTGDRVEVRGAARADGHGELGYLLTALDRPDGDLVRVRVWVRAGGAVLHDSQPGAAESAAPTTRLQGSVTIHR